MEENYLFALLISFLFGFVLFKKDKTLPNETKNTKQSLTVKDLSGSGVDRYLKNQEIASDSDKKISGVAQYIKEKESLVIEIKEGMVASSVEKYLATKEKDSPMSGVGKYMAKKAIHDKQTAKENLSGVEKYLNRDK